MTLRPRGCFWAAIAAASLVPSLALAAAGRWTSTGPSTPNVSRLAIDPRTNRTVYAIASSRLFRSLDGGTSWRDINPTHRTDNDSVFGFAVDPFHPETLYAGRYFGLVKSDDAGLTWSDFLGAVSQSGNSFVQEIEMAPSQAGRFYFHTGDALYRTDDGGDHGQALTGPWSAENAVSALAVDTGDAGTIYVGVYNLGVYRSRDAGIHWAFVGAGLPEAPNQLLVNRGQPSEVFAVTPSGGLYAKADVYDVWQPIGPAGKSVLTVAVDPTDPTRILAGSDAVYDSTDRGNSWTPHLTNSLPINQADFVASIAAAGTIYAGTTGNAVFRSDDAGATWVHGETGLARIYTVALDASSTGVVFASGGFRPSMKRGGAAWETRGPMGVGSMAVSPEGRTIYESASGCTGLPTPPCNPGIYRSTDGGDHWTRVHDVYSGALAVDPTNPDLAYAAIVTSISNEFAFGTILRTVDGGEHWEDVASALPAFAMRRLQVDPSRPERVFATDGYALYRSDDRGATWAASAASFPYIGVLDLAVSSAGAPTVYIAAINGIFRSADGGETWEQTSFVEDTESVAVDPTDSKVVYAATYSQVFRSADSGGTWSAIGLGLEGAELFLLRVDPTGNVLYAGTSDGVFEFDRRLTQVLPPR